MSYEMIFKAVAALPGYGGALTHCAGCRKLFTHGQTIYVDFGRTDPLDPPGAIGIAFCGDDIIECVEIWRQRIGQPEAVVETEPRRFHGNT